MVDDGWPQAGVVSFRLKSMPPGGGRGGAGREESGNFLPFHPQAAGGHPSSGVQSENPLNLREFNSQHCVSHIYNTSRVVISIPGRRGNRVIEAEEMQSTAVCRNAEIPTHRSGFVQVRGCVTRRVRPKCRKRTRRWPEPQPCRSRCTAWWQNRCRPRS